MSVSMPAWALAGLVCAALAAGAPLAALGQDGSTAQSSVARILVPADDPSSWPAAEWEPISADRYAALLGNLPQSVPQPRPAWVEEAEYSAEYVEGTLRGGTLSAVVRRRGAGSADLVTLDPLTADVESLWWDDATPAADPPAVWGTAAGGRMALLVDRPQGTLHGRWTLAGRRRLNGVEFDVGVIPATVSRLRIRVPADYRLTTSSGDLALADTGNPQVREYVLTLGSLTRALVRVSRDDGTAPAPQVLVERGDAVATIRRDGLQFQASLVIEALRAPVRRLTFDLPADVEVYSVSWAGDAQLRWTTQSAEDGQLLVVDLPEPLIGKSRSIRIQGLAPARLGGNWSLPHVTLRGAADLGGQYQVIVESPLQLRDCRLHGYRQTATVARPGESATFSFLRYLRDARIDVDVDAPPLDLFARVVSHLDATSDPWTARSDVLWQARSGATFALECAVAPGWDLTDVRLRSPAGELGAVQWDVQSDAAGGSRLRVDLPEPMTPGQPRTLHVVARRSVTGEEGRLLPLRPEGASGEESLLAVVHRPGDEMRLEESAGLVEVDSAGVPAFANESPLWMEVLSIDDARLRLFAATSRAEGRLVLESTEPPVDAQALQAFELGADRAVHHVSLEVQPLEQPVDRLLVYLTGQRTERTWKVAEGEDVTVTARRVPAARAAEWELAGSGELWELRLSRPVAERFRLEASGEGPLADGEDLPVAWVPEARQFDGRVEVRSVGDTNWEAMADNLIREEDGAEADLAAPAALRTVGRWRYRQVGSATRLRVRKAEEAPASEPLARLYLQSLVAPMDGGGDVHEACYVLLPSERAVAFRFALPEGADLTDVRLDGEPATASLREGEYVLPPLPAARSHEVRIRYRCGVDARILERVVAVPVPRAACKVLELHWEIAVPPDVSVTCVGKGVHLVEPLTALSWTERAFGPLGRPAHAAIFNPMRSEAWTSLWFALNGREEPAEPPADGAAALPEGWSVWRAAALGPPDVLTLTVWHGPRARLLAWLALLSTLAVGLFLRLWRVRRRQRLAAIWLAVCAATAAVAPPVPALIAGGCVSGGLIVVLLPRRFLFRPRPRDAVSAPTDSTESYRRVAVATGILGLALILCWKGTGSAAGGTAAAEAVPELALMVPVDDGGRRVGEIVYVTPALRTRLDAADLASDRAPEALITSAHYQGHVDRSQTVSFAAHFRVVVLPGSRPVSVTLPLAGTHLLGAEACVVDGQPHALLKSPDSDAYLLELEAPSPVAWSDVVAEVSHLLGRTAGGTLPAGAVLPALGERRGAREYEVVVRFVVPASLTPRGGEFSCGIPPVPAGRLSLAFEVPPRRMDVLGVAATPAPQDGREVSVELRRTDRLTVRWSDESEPEPVQPSIEAQVACHAELTPTALQLRYRASCRVVQGSIDSLAWQFPAGIVPRMPAASPSAWSLDSTAGGDRLTLELAAPQTGTFAVDFGVMLPVEARDGVLRIPVPTLLAPAARITQYQCGVATTSLFRLVPHTAEMDGIQRISASTLTDAFASGTELKLPEIAYQSPRPTEMAFRIVPAVAERTVTLVQTGRVDVGVLSWTATATVELQGAPAFRHALRVDPELRVESVSVREGETERLLHWTRHGERLVLTLSDKSGPAQTIRLTGSRPLAFDQPLALPLVQFEEAETVESRLELERGPELAVEFLQGPPPSGSVPFAVPNLVGEYRLPPDGAAPVIVARRRDDVPQVESVMAVVPGDGAQRELRMAVRLSSAATPMRIAVPSGLVEGHQLSAEGAEISLDPQQGGALEIVVHSTASDESLVVLTAPLPDAVDHPQRLPEVNVVDGANVSSYLLVTHDAHWRPVGEASRVLPPEVPEWAAEPLGFEPEEGWTAFRSQRGPWTLEAQPNPDANAPPRMTLLETRLERDGASVLQGTTRAVLARSSGDRLSFTWPQGTRLRAAILGERPASVTIRGDGRLWLSVPGSDAPLEVVLFWSREGAGASGWFDTLAPEFPQPAEIRPERRLLLVEPPTASWIFGDRGIEPQSPWQYAIAALEGELAAFESLDPEPVASSPLLAPMLARYDWLADRVARARQESGTNAAEAAAAERLATLAEAVESLRALNEASARVQEPTAAAHGLLREDPEPWQGASPSALRAAIGLEPASVSYRLVPRAPVKAALGAAIGLVVLLAVWKLLRPKWSDWLHARPALACLALGVVWWLFLAPSLLGLLLVLLSLTPWVRSARAPSAVASRRTA